MPNEIEHKFTVSSDVYRNLAERSEHIAQGYLSKDPERTVRVRIIGTSAFITVKGRNHGDTRLEFEYPVPVEDAGQMLGLCIAPVIDKVRYYIPYHGHVWEVDEFHGSLEGIVTAEIELSESGENYAIPPFVGKNVTGDPRWYNSMIADHAEELRAECADMLKKSR